MEFERRVGKVVGRKTRSSYAIYEKQDNVLAEKINNAMQNM